VTSQIPKPSSTDSKNRELATDMIFLKKICRHSNHASASSMVVLHSIRRKAISRENIRFGDDADRFARVVKGIVGKRLTYKEAAGKLAVDQI
jgi:hypothetical protein